MKQQAMIIGLGQFGMAVARALSERNVEVMAVDIRDDKVRAAAAFVTQAATFDATDEEALKRTSPERRDVCLCAIGDEAKEASIICTSLLRQMGAQRVIARANDELHARILKLVGAHQVVNPEREYGERFANRIVHREIQGEMRLGEGVLVTEVTSPESYEGKSLGELDLPKEFGVTVVAVRRTGADGIILPDPDTRLESGDVLIVVAGDGAVAKMMERS